MGLGYGHLVTNSERNSFRNGITREKARQILHQDLGEAETSIRRLVKVPVNQMEYDALTSFTFNLGSGNLSGSMLLKDLNNNDFRAAANEFPKWNHAGHNISPGLTKRRLDEQALFNGDIVFISTALRIQY